MTSFFAVDALAEVAVKLEDCKRRDELKAEIAREKAAIIAANVAGSLDAARAILERADAAALAAEFAELKARATHDDQEHAEAHASSRGNQAAGGDRRRRRGRAARGEASNHSRGGQATERGATSPCARASRRRTRRCASFATAIAAR